MEWNALCLQADSFPFNSEKEGGGEVGGQLVLMAHSLSFPSVADFPDPTGGLHGALNHSARCCGCCCCSFFFTSC